MTKGEALRDFVKERLSAAAEEIFAQFERTIAEYEEEVWRSKEKSRRKRALLESALNPRVVLLREAVNTGPVWSPGPDPNPCPDQEDQEIPETAQITDEPEEEHLQERVPESSAVFAKTEASSLLPQTEPQGEETQGEETQGEETQGEETQGEETQGEETQGEETQGEETQGEDVSAEPHFHSEADRDVERSSFNDYDEEWGAPLSSADDDDHDDQDQTGTQAEESAPESSAAVNDDDVSGTAEGSERKSHQCHVCKKKLRGSKHDLVKHMRIHTGERPYSCSVCQKKFNQMGHLNVHKRIHTRASPYSCSTCSKSFSRLVDLNTHSKTHSEERPSPRPSPSPGPGPNQEIPETSRITDEPNEESVRPEEERLQVHVPESSAVFVKTDSLLPQTEAQEETQGEEPHLHSKPDRDVERSSDTHNEEKWRLVQVQIGTSATSADPSSTADNDASGTAQGPEDKMQECPVCKKRLKGDKQKLQQHMRIHTGEKPYSCSVCNKAFSRMDYLNVHRRTHTGERRYICSICNKTFSRMDYLNAHRRTHTGEKPYRCTICDETFSHSRELNNHRRAHTGERPYNCPICQKEFTRPFKLKCHLRLHTGEKPFSCSICKKEYAQPNGLQYHMRVHSGEKPFSCPHCNRTFSAKSTLRVHVRTHTGERPYSCSICNKAFAQLSNLNVHRKKHNEDGQLSNPRPGLSRGLHQETPETSRIKDEPEEEYLQITI